MKDMGRCGNIAFCAMVLFYCSFITGDYLCVSSAAHVSSSPHISHRRNGVTDVNLTSSPGSDQTQSSTNITNSTEPMPHTDTTTETLMNSSAPAENVSFSGNITDSRNDLDVSPVNNETAVTTVKPTTLLPSTTLEPTSTIHISTLHPTSSRAPDVSSPESTSAHSRLKSTPPASSPSTATAVPVSSSPVRAKAHGDTPSALNVGDHDNSKASTDPLLAGLVSAFVVIAAIVSVLIFLKFRNTNDGPEFRRLQDLPMVSAHSLYVTDDANVAIFPGASGFFSTLDLTPRAHYEVHGEEEDASSASNATARFTFMRSPATATNVTPSPSSSAQRAASAPLRATASKTFQRSVFLAEVVGGRLSPSRMVVVRFLESEATLQGIIGKVQDAIGCHDPMVLTDVQGNAILESEGTTGSQYWKQNARKILAIQEQAFQEVQGSKRRRMSRKDEDAAGIGEVTEKIEELVLASQTLPDITAAIRELTNLAATQRVILTPSQLQTIKQGFCCVICMKFIEEPVFTECCRSIIGCKTCGTVAGDLCALCKM